MSDRPIGECLFTDGITRTVFLDGDDRQYILEDDGTPVYGVWLYVDEPMIAERGEGSAQQEGMR